MCDILQPMSLFFWPFLWVTTSVLLIIAVIKYPIIKHPYNETNDWVKICNRCNKVYTNEDYLWCSNCELFVCNTKNNYKCSSCGYSLKEGNCICDIDFSKNIKEYYG